MGRTLRRRGKCALPFARADKFKEISKCTKGRASPHGPRARVLYSGGMGSHLTASVETWIRRTRARAFDWREFERARSER